MYKLFSSLALVAAFVAAPAALHAAPITFMSGQFSIQGTVTNNPTTTVLTFVPSTVETGFGTQTGTFATLLTNNEHASAGTPTIDYSPYTPGSAFFTVGPLTATIETLTDMVSTVNGHTVFAFSGTADFAAAGYLTTPGSFTFSTQDSGPVTFSATAMATPSADTPEPTSLLLFGTGVLGLAGVASRKFSHAKHQS